MLFVRVIPEKFLLASQQEEMLIIFIFATIVEKSKDNLYCDISSFSNPVFTKSTQIFSQVY